MKKLFDSFWRAAVYCIHPRVIVLSVVPFLLMGALSFGLGYLYWETALADVRASLEGYELVKAVINWLNASGADSLYQVLSAALLLALMIPVNVMLTLLFVALFMMPFTVKLVAGRRFATLERKKGGSFMASLAWALGSTAMAGLALLLSIPLWLVPPLILVLPPLIWGWLTYRVMAYDALAGHASLDELRQIFAEHQGPLLAIGIISGYLGTVPSVLWASGALFVALMPLLVPLALWLYTLVFAFSSLWFAHYCLAALEQLRKKKMAPAPAPAPAAAPVPAPPPPLPGFNVNIPKFLVHMEPVPTLPPPAAAAAGSAAAPPASGATAVATVAGASTASVSEAPASPVSEPSANAPAAAPPAPAPVHQLQPGEQPGAAT